MTRFDDFAAHTLVCQQANTGIPEEHRECVCPPHVTALAIEHASETSRRVARTMPSIVAPTFRPDFGIEGPFGFTERERRRTLQWLAWALAIPALAFITGALLRHFGVI